MFHSQYALNAELTLSNLSQQMDDNRHDKDDTVACKLIDIEILYSLASEPLTNGELS